MNSLTKAILNCIITGALVFLGAFTDGSITRIEMIASLGAAGIAALTQFKDFLSEDEEDKYRVFNFIT